jgi:hypothetical protein
MTISDCVSVMMALLAIAGPLGLAWLLLGRRVPVDPHRRAFAMRSPPVNKRFHDRRPAP